MSIKMIVVCHIFIIADIIMCYNVFNSQILISVMAANISSRSGYTCYKPTPRFYGPKLASDTQIFYSDAHRSEYTSIK